MAWFEIVSELLRLHVVFMLAFVPLFLFGVIGLYKQKNYTFILFVIFCFVGSIIFDLRILITGQLFLLWGWTYWLKKKTKLFIVFSSLLFLLFLFWWINQKLWYFGMI